MSNSFRKHEIKTYQFLIDAHIEMIGGKKTVDKEYSELKKIEQLIKETIGTLDKKNFPQKLSALKLLFKMQNNQRNKIFNIINKVLKYKVLRNKSKLKMDNQEGFVAELRGRFDRTDKALNKYDNMLETMTQEAATVLSGKAKRYKRYKSLESFEMSQLNEELKAALADVQSDDATKLQNSSERASTVIWAAGRIVKKTRKKHDELNKQVQSAQKTYLKLQKAHQLTKQRVEVIGTLVEAMISNYNTLQTNIFSLTDSIKANLLKTNIQKLVPKITADIQESVEAAGGSYEYDDDEDDEVFSGGATKSRLHKYGNTVEKLLRSYDKTFKRYEIDTKTRNKTLIDNLGVYGDILVKLSNVNDLIQTYINDGERLQEIAGVASDKVNVAINEWRRTTEDGMNKDRKKITDNMSKDGTNNKQEAEGGYF